MSPSLFRRCWMAYSNIYLIGMTSSALQAINTFSAYSSPAKYFFQSSGALIPFTSFRIGWVIFNSSLIFLSPPFKPSCLIIDIKSKLMISDQSTPSYLAISGRSNLLPLNVTTALQVRISCLNWSRLNPLIQYLMEYPSNSTIEVILNLSPIICLRPVVSMSRQAISSMESVRRSLLERLSWKYLQSLEQQRSWIYLICWQIRSLFLLAKEAGGRFFKRARKVFMPYSHSLVSGRPSNEKLARVMLSNRQVLIFGLKRSGYLVRKVGTMLSCVYSVDS